MRKVRIAGIGNVLMGDDGIGPFAIKMLESQYDFQDGLELIDVGTPGLDLPLYLSGADALILIDAAQFDSEPGSVRLFRKSDVLRNPLGLRMDPHSPALQESLALVELMGKMPSDFLLIGVQGNRFDLGESLTTSVRQAVPRVIDAVLSELQRLNVSYCRAANARQPVIWWDPLPNDYRGNLLCA